MKFNEKEKAYIEQELNLPELEEGEKVENQVYEDWLLRECKPFKDESIEVLEGRISVAEALEYHDKCSPTFYEIISLRLKTYKLSLDDKLNEQERVAKAEAKKVAAEKRKVAAAKKKASKKKLASSE